MLKYITKEQLDEIVKLSLEHRNFRDEQKKAGNEVYESSVADAIERVVESVGPKGWYELWLLYFLGTSKTENRKLDLLELQRSAWENIKSMYSQAQYHGSDVDCGIIASLPFYEFYEKALENIEKDKEIRDLSEKLEEMEREIFPEHDSGSKNRDSIPYSVLLEEAVSYIERMVASDPKNTLVARLAAALDKTKDSKETN